MWIYLFSKILPKNMRKLFVSSLFAWALFFTVSAQKKKTVINPNEALKNEAISDLQSKYADYRKIAFQIWDYAEVGAQIKASEQLFCNIVVAKRIFQRQIVPVFREKCPVFRVPRWTFSTRTFTKPVDSKSRLFECFN